MATQVGHNFKLPYFNEIGCDASIKALQLLHLKTREMQCSYSLHFCDAENAWYVRVDSAAEIECYMSNEYSLSSALELVFNHISKFVFVGEGI